ncbi:MAG TPA: fasciclin domain-containing protein [Solirubrobacterales bacterium]|nr:fasciclin domain-containing protein [Solirubrobacterales bacterium]
MLKRILAVTTVVAVLAVPAGTATAAPSKNIVETAAGAPQFSTLVSLVKKAGLVKALSGEKPLTVFAPTNAAFEKVPKKTLNTLLGDRKLLREVLLYHVVAGKLPASKVVKRSGAETLQGERVSFTVKGQKVFVNQARVITPDIRASNGIIHAINQVLIPANLGGMGA